jgi:hypothetical protein
MIHTETVTHQLLQVARRLCEIPALNTFRIVGGTAVALHLGHRKSVDIDLFTSEKVDKDKIRRVLEATFPNCKFDISEDAITSEIQGVKVELFDDWSTPFLEKPVVEDGLRLASLNDLAALKLDTIIGRREKKDYIDLHVLFESLGAAQVLKQFNLYNAQASEKSVMFALEEVKTARDNKTIMPVMLINISWPDIEKSMFGAAREFVTTKQALRRKR